MVHFKRLALLSLAIVPSAFAIALPIDDVDGAIKAEINPSQLNKLTNADRFAKGLGPLPPTRRSTGAKPKRSGNPNAENNGDNNNNEDDTNFRGPVTIRLRNPRDGRDMGSIGSPSGDNDLVNLDIGHGAIRLQFGPGAMTGSPFDISPADSDSLFNGRRTQRLGAMPGHGRPDMARGSPNFIHVGLADLGDDGLLNLRLPSRLLGALPTEGMSPNLLGGLLGDVLPLGPGPNYPVQSTIWSFEPRTRRLLAHYSNPNGQTIPTSFVTGGPCEHLICLTADVNAFHDAFGDSAQEIHAFVTVL